MAWEATHLLSPLLLVLLASGEGQVRWAEGGEQGRRRGRWLGEVGMKRALWGRAQGSWSCGQRPV